MENKNNKFEDIKIEERLIDINDKSISLIHKMLYSLKLGMFYQILFYGLGFVTGMLVGVNLK